MGVANMQAAEQLASIAHRQEAYERLDSREAKARQAEADLADARAAAQVGCSSAVLPVVGTAVHMCTSCQ